MTKPGMSYEEKYSIAVNLYGLAFLVAVSMGICAVTALMSSQALGIITGIALLLLAGPAAVLFKDRASRRGATVISISAMGLCALLIHVSGGAIEAHFLVFVLIPMLVVYGRMEPLLVAGATIVLHHITFWLWLPSSVFNYRASLSMVLIHGFFVALEVVPMCWISRQLARSIRARSLVSRELSAASGQIATAILEVSAVSKSLARGTSVQAVAIEQTAASVTELHAMARRNTENASQTSKMVNLAQDGFRETNACLQDMLTAMESMNQASYELAGMIQVIDQIAFQTNILALNAAVEAARAGEAGSGFAVVADEVRSLAKRSAQAAKDCSDLIEDSIVKSKASKEKVDRVASSILTITSHSSTMESLIHDISLASAEQTIGIDQISSSIYSMERTTQETKASTAETENATLQLQQQSETLERLVRRLAEDGTLTAKSEHDGSQLNVASKPQAGELPSRGRREEVPIRVADVIRWREA